MIYSKLKQNMRVKKSPYLWQEHLGFFLDYHLFIDLLKHFLKALKKYFVSVVEGL